MEPHSELICARVREAFADRDRFLAALRKIADINNGPDKASGEWRCGEAARIAFEALAGDDLRFLPRVSR